ncbi:uncharacterized protein LOC126988852 [Eriocheir sinensis]|uniref:uncharacterized protein LOC126988852 n=1 Tax=Eriocheir sinensis TaxID=95602 RepID=UPI0021CA22CA|nr:uncharacterized protein LOC126988852 [Eriocheir sinensis]
MDIQEYTPNLAAGDEEVHVGRPAVLEDISNPDWAPTQNLGHRKVSQELVAISCARHQRIQERKLKKDKEMFMAAQTLMDIQEYTQPCHDEVHVEQQEQLSLLAIGQTFQTEKQTIVSRPAACQTETVTVATVGCQRDLTLMETTMFDQQDEDLNQLRTEVYELRSTVGDYNNLNLSNDDEKVLFIQGCQTMLY